MITKAKNSTYAVYNGKEYKAGKNTRIGKIVLFSSDPQDLQNGFTQMAPGKYKKEVLQNELGAAHFIHTFATYGGFKFQITSIADGKATLGHYYDDEPIKHLGFTWIEPFVYEKTVPLEELEEIFEERKPIWGFEEK